MARFDALKTARKLLANVEFPIEPIKTGTVVPLYDENRTKTISETASKRLADLMDQLRTSDTAIDVTPENIEQQIAEAVKENTMTDERVQSVSDHLVNQMLEYADKINNKIAEIQADQNTANDQHADAIETLRREIEEREKAHSDLTASNDARIADHRRALAGIKALFNSINPGVISDAAAPLTDRANKPISDADPFPDPIQTGE